MRVFPIALMFAITSLVTAQDSSISGLWKGTFKNGTIEIEAFFEFSGDANSLMCKMNVPDQFIKDSEASDVLFRNDSLSFNYPSFRSSFNGVYKAEMDEIHGNWVQGGSTPLILTRSSGFEQPQRPQEPKPPFTYSSEEVTFKNNIDNVELSGTLTIPTGSGPFPVAVLVSGSGPQNRNSEIMNHKPFLVISDHLTKNGIAVLRYDDRGVGKSTGNYAIATTMDLSNDALAAVSFLKTRKDINQNKIGVIGHSEGGMIAPVVANKIPELGFLILLAGPGQKIPDLMVTQNSNLFKQYGFTDEELVENEAYNSKIFNLAASDRPSEELFDTIQKLSKEYYNNLEPKHKPLFGQTPEVYYLNLATQLFSPWFRGFLQFNAREFLINVSCPVLALNGSKDIQVPSKSNLDAIGEALKDGGNQDYTVKELEGLNHLFQKCESCTVREYGLLEETFSVEVLDIMTNWIKKRL